MTRLLLNKGRYMSHDVHCVGIVRFLLYICLLKGLSDEDCNT